MLKQIYWVRLRRDFPARIDRSGDGKTIGERLLKRSHRLFDNWHRVWDGTLDWEPFGKRMVRLRREVRQSLEEGHWKFARIKGIEPKNNAAERALRFAVIGRRISSRRDSERGGRFVERALTVVASCRQQGRNVLEYLSSCVEAEQRSQPIPSLRSRDQSITKLA